MSEIVRLTLPRDFVGQLLEVVEIAIEDWHRTKTYLEDGVIDYEEPYIRECSDAEEAGKIETYYKKIKAEIEKQFDK